MSRSGSRFSFLRSPPTRSARTHQKQKTCAARKTDKKHTTKPKSRALAARRTCSAHVAAEPFERPTTPDRPEAHHTTNRNAKEKSVRTKKPITTFLVPHAMPCAPWQWQSPPALVGDTRRISMIDKTDGQTETKNAKKKLTVSRWYCSSHRSSSCHHHHQLLLQLSSPPQTSLAFRVVISRANCTNKQASGVRAAMPNAALFLEVLLLSWSWS